MGFKKTHIQERTGESTPNAYYRVEGINLKHGESIGISLMVFSSQANRDAGKDPIERIRIRLSSDDKNFEKYFGLSSLEAAKKNPIKQAYKYIKDKVDGYDSIVDAI